MVDNNTTTPHTTTLSPTIDIFIVNNECLVWDEEDIFKIRTTLRLIGNLIGSLEDLKNLSTLNSIPFVLSPYEVKLGLDKGWFRIVDESKSYPIPTKETIDNFTKERDNRYKHQMEVYAIERLKKQQEYQDSNKQKEQKEKKEKKLQLKKQKQQENSNNNNNNNNNSNTDNIDNTDNVKNEIDIKNNSNNNNENKDNNKKQKTSHNDLYKNHDISIYTSTKEAIENEPETKEWRDKREFNVISNQEYYFPSNEIESIKYLVFKDLWEKGYSLTSGLKFGGTFLAYKGDPFLYHAAYIVIIKKFDQEFQSLELIKSARLAVNVNKNILFASIEPITNEPTYFVADWKGVT